MTKSRLRPPLPPPLAPPPQRRPRSRCRAFVASRSTSATSLSVVAPGIAEALVATAIGLFAAIPAVVAYNRFTNELDRISIRFDSFIDEFLNILQRQVN